MGENLAKAVAQISCYSVILRAARSRGSRSTRLLADGTVIASLEDLKRYILERRLDAFTRGFVEGVVQYAAGRRLDLADERSVELAQRAFIDAGYDFRALVQAVAASASFTGLPE